MLIHFNDAVFKRCCSVNRLAAFQEQFQNELQHSAKEVAK